MTPEQVRAHMLDYLYDELSEEGRREFEAAVAASDSHRRELAALERTLGLARSALSRELSQEPPVAVRPRVLAAAREAARADGAPADKRARAAQPTEQRGLWALLRAPWLYPAVGFAAALIIVIVIDRRERASEAGPAPHEEAPVSAPSRDTLAPASKAEEQGGAAASERGLGGQSSERVSPELKRRAGSSRGSSGAARPSPEEPASAATGRAAKPASRARTREYAAPPPSAAPAERSFESPSKAEPFPGSAQDDGAERRDRGSVTAEGARPAPAASAAPRADSLDRAPRRTSAPGATSAPPPSVAPRAEEVARESERDFAGAPAKGAGAESEPLARRAAEQLRDGLFAEAVKSYHELLRRFPSDARVAEWRRALALAQRALRADAGDAR